MQETPLTVLEGTGTQADPMPVAVDERAQTDAGATGVLAAIRRLFQFVRARLAAQVDEQSPRSAIASLDGVRGIACLLVVGYHISLMTQARGLWSVEAFPLGSAIMLNGGSGVMLFFVLSGFLLFMPYARALLFARSLPSARQFYLRRALRILPGYYVSLVLLVLLTSPEYLEPRRWLDLLLFATMLMDSTRATDHAINGPYWTLAIEWQFYLLLPLIALAIYLVARRVRPAWRLSVVAGCLLLLLAWGLGSTVVGDYFKRFPTETVLVPRAVLNVVLWFIYGMESKYLQDFAFGMLASLLYIYVTTPGVAAKYRRVLRRLSPWLLACGVLVLLELAMAHISQAFGVHWPVLDGMFQTWGWSNVPGYPLGFGLCIVAILFGSSWLTAIFRWLPLRWMGMISYALYIWHLPLLVAFDRHVGPSLAGLHPLLAYSLYWVWALVVVVPFALGIYLLVERPGMRLSARLRRRATADARAG